jgi:uncharacterized protein (TIGR02594 family)
VSTISKWLRATVDNKPWWAIILAACLASLGSELVKSIPTFISSARSLFPIEPTIFVVLKNKGAGPPGNGPKISIMDASTRAFLPIVNSSETSVTMKDGIAELKVRLKPKLGYLIVLNYTDGNKTYRHTELISISGDLQTLLTFDKDTWPPPAEEDVKSLQIAPPSATIDFPADLPPWMKVAYGELGQREISGANHNPRILEYFQSLPITQQPKDDETPWSSAFINWVFNKSGITGSGGLGSRSWMRWGVASPLKPGCVAVFWSGSPEAETGHAGFLWGVQGDGSRLAVLGGNQSDQVSIAVLPKSRLLGCRLPS